MSGKQEHLLESIIKLEPEAFQAISSDDVLRFKAKIFSDPIVLVKRLNFKVAAVTESQKEFGSKKTVVTSTKSNEKKSWPVPQTCSTCQKIFANRYSLKIHYENMHRRSTGMLCDLCPKVYFRKRNIINHMKLVHFKKAFTCNFCDFKTSDKYSYQNHKITHTAKVECPICLKQVSVLKVHMITHKNASKVPCTICKKEVRKKCLRNHMKTHIEIKCKDCDEVFDNREIFRSHKILKHYDGKIFKCHCGSAFQSNVKFMTHQKEVHSTEKSTCKVCQKELANLRSLKAHWKLKHLKTHGILEIGSEIRTLNRSGPFICDKCGTKHSSRVGFFSHNYLYHGGTTSFCDLCPRSFTRKVFLIKHIEKDHLKLRPFQCNYCEYRSYQKCELRAHIKQHGSKTECKICHKFYRDMYNHLRCHVKVRCLICSKIISKRWVSKHLKTHKK